MSSTAQEKEEAKVTPPESESEEEQAPPPLHDVTATTVSGARVRRSTQKYTVAAPKEDDTEAFTPPRGPGQQLRDIPGAGDAVAALGKKQAETLKALYLVMYSRRFQLKNLKTIKEHILAFSGIPEAEQSAKAREALFGKIARWQRSFVQEVMDVLGVDRSKKSFDAESKPFDKDALISRLIDWLYHPQETKAAKKAVTPKAAKKAEKTPAKRKSTAKDAAPKKKQKTAAVKKTKTKKSEAADDDEDEEEEEEEDAEGDGDESDYEEEDAKKKKKKRAKPTAAAKAKGTEAPEDDEDKKDEKEKDLKGSGGDASTLDADVQAKVKQIIAQGNAEELTVKKIVRQVSEELGRDLTAEKNAIKEFIKAGQ